jgi:hypothetical protein
VTYHEDPTTDRRLFVGEGNDCRRVYADLFPGGQASGLALIVRPVNFRGRLVYIGAEPTNDHQWTPFGLFTTSSIDRAELVKPDHELPYDILVYDGRCYVLTVLNPWTAADMGGYLMKVWASDDLTSWRELLVFYAQTFARSFEILGGDFYFGLGCQSTQGPPETGSILRIRRDKIRRNGYGV